MKFMMLYQIVSGRVSAGITIGGRKPSLLFKAVFKTFIDPSMTGCSDLNFHLILRGVLFLVY